MKDISSTEELQARSSVDDYANELNDSIGKYIELLNKSYFDNYKLKTVSFIAKIFGSKKYLLDYDYKEYYVDVNKLVIYDKLDRLFETDDGKNWLENSYVYYEYNYDDVEDIFELYDYKYSPTLESKKELTNLIYKWLPICHSAINNVSEKVKNNIKVWTCRVKGPDECKRRKSFFKLVFLFHQIEIDNILDGHINITYLKKESSTETRKGIANETLTAIVEDFFKLKYPLIEAKAVGTLIPVLNEDVIKKSLIAAVAAIMSRNMSHNLGSHILSYVKNHLSSTGDMIKDKVFENLVLDVKNDANSVTFSLNDSFYDWENLEISKSKNQDHPNAAFLIGLGKFINYLQERQDYIATITSNWQPLYSTVNFKDFVYDELTHDKKAERHKDSHEKQKNVLLEYIARSEDYTRDDIVIKFRNFDGEEIDKDDTKSYSDFKAMRKLDIDLPAGIMGRQAIFSIIENFIRNSAKHGGNLTKNKKLEITIDLIEDNEHKDYYQFKLMNNNRDGSDDVIKKLRVGLETPIVELNGVLNEDYKGLKEMKISAAWLRRIGADEIQAISKSVHKSISIHNPEILIVDSDENNNIYFTFYVFKSRKVAVILRNNTLKREYQSKFNFVGWEFFHLKELEICDSIPYKFVLIDNIKDMDFPKEKLPFRVLTNDDFGLAPRVKTSKTCSNVENFLNVSNDNEEELMHAIYAAWLKKNEINVLENKIIISDIGTTCLEHKGIDNDLVKCYTSISEAEEEELIRENRTIIFNKHNDSPNEFLKFKKGYEKLFKKSCFIEGISGGNSTDRLIRNEIKDAIWAYKMIESALTKVLIVDERLWKEVKNNDHQSEIYGKKRITILNFIKSSNDDSFLIKDSLDEDIGEIDCFEKDIKIRIDLKKLEPSQFDFVLIHQGILDKIIGVSSDVNRCFDRIRVAFFGKRYIIHSGRSKPPEKMFPKGVAFIQYSSLENSLKDCKFTLTELLFSTIIGGE